MKQITVEVPEEMISFFKELMSKLEIPVVESAVESGLSEEDLDELQRREAKYLESPDQHRPWEEMEAELLKKYGKQ